MAQSKEQGLLGTYYHGPHFDKKVAVRLDKQINFHWDQQHKPIPGLEPGYFSVRWTGQLYIPATGVYYFSAKANDDVRLWIDGRTILGDWSNEGPIQNSVAAFVPEKRNFIHLQGKQWYAIKVEYANAWDKSDIALYWERPEYMNSESALQGVFRKVIPAQNFSPVSKPIPTVSSVSTLVKSPRQRISPPKRVQESIQKTSGLSARDIASPSKPRLGIKLDKGKSIILDQVQFSQSSYVLTPESFPVLDQLVRLLNENPTQRIEISGHTDNVGDANRNVTLSEYRAKQVANYLIKQGISANRIDAKGYGSQRPIADNHLDAERAKNRRVEILAL